MTTKLFLSALACAVLLSVAACEGGDGAATAALAARVQQLEDERAVLGVVDALDIAVDDKQWDRARAMFADQVSADFSSLGGAPGTISADDLVSGWRANLFETKPSFHLRGGAIVTIDGDTALAVTNGYAWNALPQRVENNLWEVWGRYEFALTRTPQGWKINAMTFRAAHQRGSADIRSETEAQP